MQTNKLPFHTSILLLCFLTLSTTLFAQLSGELQGNVIDAVTGEGIPFANVEVEVEGKLRGAQTDFDGFYSIKPIPPGTYQVSISFVGYATDITERVIITANKITFHDVKLKEKSAILEAVVVKSYKVPLLKADETSTGATIGGRSGYAIPTSSMRDHYRDRKPKRSKKKRQNKDKIATRSVTSLASSTAGVYSEQKSQQVNIRGGREGTEEYYIDGMRVRGSLNLIQDVTEQLNVTISGTPARYENTTSDDYLSDQNNAINSEESTINEQTHDQIPVEPISGESYAEIVDNPFVQTSAESVSTFSIDVDNASYSNMRRFINHNTMPPKHSIRIEEMINYFNYDYAPPTDEHPFAIHTEVAPSPWAEHHLLAHIGLQGKSITFKDAPTNNLVFLIDVSGSMSSRNKLPLVKKSLRMLTEKMRPQDQVAMVVYAGAAGLVLPATPFSQQEAILAAIERLEAGGSTAGAAGLELAYQIAQESFIPNGSNRVILATDGDFNVGPYSDASMEELIKEKRKSGIFLSVLGFGMGNYQDSKMERLANKGNGNYAYIDDIKEAQKVLIEEMNGTLITIAKDVKIQVAFDSTMVQSYRLIGYANRLLENEDFEDDTKDAGELGAGHTVTALYELVLKQPIQQLPTKQELMNVKFRYKKPTEDQSRLMVHPATSATIGNTSNNFRFSAAVAAFGMLLRNSPYQGTTNYDKVLNWAKSAKGEDQLGYRKEFIQLIKQTKKLSKKQKREESTIEVKK